MEYMDKIAITKITVVDADRERTSRTGRYVLDKLELENYRESIVRDGIDIDHVLFTYEEVRND